MTDLLLPPSDAAYGFGIDDDVLVAKHGSHDQKSHAGKGRVSEDGADSTGRRVFERVGPFDPSRTSELHLNLNRSDKVFSVRQGGKVVAYTSDAVITSASLPVGKGGLRRFKQAMEGRGKGEKTVHAFVRGKFDPSSPAPKTPPAGFEEVTYNPAKTDTPNFWWKSDGAKIPTSQTFDKIVMIDWKVYAPRPKS